MSASLVDDADLDATYYVNLAAAFVRGKIGIAPNAATSAHDLLRRGLSAGLRLHKFKRTMELRRVSQVLGTLRGLAPRELLDIGSGRGTFLWPLVDAFPDLPITAVDISERRVADILAARAGGLGNLAAHAMDATRLGFADDAFDVVTMLEVLEHIPRAQGALEEAVRVARRFLVLSVPSKSDNNPEHIHLFSGDMLTDMLRLAGARRITIEYVLGHIIAVARVFEP
jgi:ubiquinone/menaquinone biosynthesis C-methylase UbiE